MPNIKELEQEIQSLKNRNKILEFKLNIARLWMTREIKESVKKINRNNISNIACNLKNNFANDNLEDIVTENIRKYFGDYVLMNIGTAVIENIVSAEIAYYNLKQNPNYDWFWVISSFHKALDAIIEQFIMKWYRKYAKKSDQIHLRKNDSIEKAFHSVVNKWFILSMGRLFHILKSIKNKEILYDYWKNFSEYLDKYIYLKDVLLSDDFLSIYKEVLDTEILWKKRHSWQITFVETRKARELLVWNLKDKKSLIYMFLSTQDMEF